MRVSDALTLPFEDGSFDVLIMAQVLLYVDDVPRALAEAIRVLKPGGRLLVCDTDWDSLVVHTTDPSRFERIREACCSTFVDAHLPPKLAGLLTHAGFRVAELRTVPMASVGQCASPASSWVGNWAFNVVPAKARAYGLPESDVDGWLKEQRSLSSEGAFFACVHRFLFLAFKPKPASAPYNHRLKTRGRQ